MTDTLVPEIIVDEFSKGRYISQDQDLLPQTTTERLLAVADLLESRPELWDQRTWGEDYEREMTPQDCAQLHVCNTVACIAGWGVRYSPVELVTDLSWSKAGAAAFGLSEDLADVLFMSTFYPPSVPETLRQVASIKEGERGLYGALQVGMRHLPLRRLFRHCP